MQPNINPSVTDVKQLILALSLIKPYLTSDEAAEFLGTTPQVIKSSRIGGELFGRPAPEFIRVGARKICYCKSTLIEWIESAPKGTVSGAEVSPQRVVGGEK